MEEKEAGKGQVEADTMEELDYEASEETMDQEEAAEQKPEDMVTDNGENGDDSKNEESTVVESKEGEEKAKGEISDVKEDLTTGDSVSKEKEGLKKSDDVSKQNKGDFVFVS